VENSLNEYNKQTSRWGSPPTTPKLERRRVNISISHQALSQLELLATRLSTPKGDSRIKISDLIEAIGTYHLQISIAPVGEDNPYEEWVDYGYQDAIEGLRPKMSPYEIEGFDFNVFQNYMKGYFMGIPDRKK
jgi:hypothetical protein